MKTASRIPFILLIFGISFQASALTFFSPDSTHWLLPKGATYLDCNGDENGTAFIDSCGNCAGGNTGRVPDLACAEGDTMYVQGRHLYTANGERVILRGVNEMFVWSNNKTGSNILPQIAKTGANCVRLVWDTGSGSKTDLVSLIKNCIANKMIAMPECHSATGDWSKLDVCINFWNHPDLISVIQENRRFTLLNIGNEVGDGNVTDAQFNTKYKEAIDSLRGWGYTVPIVIDATLWGQNADQVIRCWKEILQHDPLKNVIFSVHSYWSATTNYTKIANESLNNGLPVIVGEGPSPTAYPNCSLLDYGTGLRVLGENSIGWLAWSWGYLSNAHCTPNLDITTNGIFGNWETDIAVNMMVRHPYSLMRTSERPPSFFPEGKVPVSGITFIPVISKLNVGDSVGFETFLAPSNAVNKSVQYEISGDIDAVSFNESTGVLKALQAGTIQLKAISRENPSISFSRTIALQNIPVSSIKFTPVHFELEPGDTVFFSFTV